ncbi:MAG: lipid-A-disaccharide synthase, partial [Bacteroidales bacterium]|nr:lipid-A-disaccharide synthase [Bacteroidales bacterium]
QPREEFLAAHSLPDKKFLALLAGSRKEEIKRMMPVYMQLADELARTKGFEDFEFLLAGAPARSREDYEVWIAGRSNVHLIFNDTYGILHNSVSAVINSGTASLEAALIGTPQVVCWTTSAVNAFIAQNIFHILDRIKYISLGNLILDKSVFRELIQTDFTLENVLAEVQSITLDDTRRCAMLADYAQIRASLGGTGTSIAVAQSMVDLIK